MAEVLHQVVAITVVTNANLQKRPHIQKYMQDLYIKKSCSWDENNLVDNILYFDWLAWNIDVFIVRKYGDRASDNRD